MSFEKELEELRKVKPELDSERISHLQSLLDAFCHCHRYALMGSVHLARFFDAPDEVPRILTSLTAADFVEQGVVEIVSHEDVHAEHVDQLIYIFEGLLEGIEEGSEQSDEIITSSPSGTDIQRERPTYQAPIYSSIEAERKLHDAQAKLLSLEHFAALKKHKIGHYWDHSIIHAPFLEELTLEDFADIRIENLLKKKNVGNVKIHALLVALDNAIKESSSQDRVQDQSPNIVDSEQRGFWSQTPASVPQYLQGFLVDFEQSALGIKSTQPLIQLWKALPSLFQPQEFLVLWLVQEHGNEQLVQQQLSLSCDDYDACRNEAQKKLAHYCREHLLPLVTLWSEQLKGPGIQESLLIAPQMCRGSLEERQQLLGRMVLASLGAVHPRYREHIFQKHWTFDAEALSFAIESVLEGCNEKEDIKQKKLEVLLPQFSADELLILFNDEK